MVKQTVLVSLATCLGLVTSTSADFELTITSAVHPDDNDVLVDTIILMGGTHGASLVSISGVPGQPMVLETTLGTQFFNIDSVNVGGTEVFDGQSPFIPGEFVTLFEPDAEFDSGMIAFAGHEDAVSTGFTDEFGAFAFGDGMSSLSENVSIGDPSNPIPFDSFGFIDVLRITWPWWIGDVPNYVTFSAIFTIDHGPLVGTEDHYLTITNGWIPAPGAMAMLGIAGLVMTGQRRRRR